MATEIPEARGFAAALERHLANGGGMRKSGFDRKAGNVFTKGKARGLTVEEATRQARDMWDKAPGSVRDKYSRRAGAGLLAPSERRAMMSPTDAVKPVPGDRAANGRAFRAELGLPPEATPAPQYGATAMVPDKAKVASTDRAPNPGLAAAAVPKLPAGAGVTRSPQGLAGLEKPKLPPGAGVTLDPAGLSGQPKQRRINPLTGKPFGWLPSDDAPVSPKAPAAAPVAKAATGYAGPKTGGGRYDPDLGHVPSAVPVKEAPMTQAEYDKLGQDIKKTLDPRSPEFSAALGRRRTFEDEQMKAKAAVMRRERLGPSFAEREANERKAIRGIEKRLEGSYGRVS